MVSAAIFKWHRSATFGAVDVFIPNNFAFGSEGQIEAFKAPKDSFLQALSLGLLIFEIYQKNRGVINFAINVKITTPS